MINQIICSAIKLSDGQVFRGHRHHDCFKAAKERIDHRNNIGLSTATWKELSLGMIQGFISAENKFVDRAEGMIIQLAAGIRSVSSDGKGYRDDRLYSEDLY